MPRASLLGPGLLAGLVLPLVACGGSPLVGAAERGDYTRLKAGIEQREKAGDLTNGDAAAIAKAVAEREIRTARDVKEATRRVREVRTCARELDDVLEDRSKTHDDAGAEAVLARIEAGELDAGDARVYVGDGADAWRAVGARGLTRAEDRAARPKAMTDASPLVRREAIRAARVAADPADAPTLLETARLDPEPMLRAEAVRAISVVPASSPFDAANRLRDLWNGADDGLREDIAIAWASPNVYGFGGREALSVMLASGEGAGVIEAAAAVLRSPSASDLRDVAVAQLARSIASGTKRARLHAIAVARTDAASAIHKALEQASKDDDPDVKVAALARLTEIPSHRDAAIKDLEAIAATRGGPEASRAKLALASAGDRRVQAWIEKDLASPNAYERLGALSGLAALGVSARGAPLLVDADASVRTTAACQLIVAARGHK